MNVETKKNDVYIYHLDIAGENGTWLWDFGVFTLIGSKDYPIRSPGNITTFSSVLDKLDASEISNKTPDEQRTLDLYIGDYIVYVETTFDNATHFVSQENKLYDVIELTAYKGQSENTILRKNSSTSKDKIEIYDKDYLSNWTPVLEIL